jgi:eukaryotic-like serine/threonine-protein kinase
MAETPSAPHLLSTVAPTENDAAQEVPLQSGTRYGRFALQRFHARGGLGEVYVAVDAELGREVALKRMQGRIVHDAGAKRRFLNEAEITANLEHPGIVPIYGLVQDEQGQTCYAMRFIAGESLADAIKKWHGTAPDYAALSFRQLLQRFISVCQTMAYAHSKEIIHRDLKPANVMLGPYGETLVVDWGLAKRGGSDQQSTISEEAEPLPATVDYQPSDTEDQVVTQAGQVLGTAGYMSPEQAAGRVDVIGQASDIYSLGATLYELLTGQRPVRKQDIRVMLQQTQAGDYPAPRHVQPAVPQALEAICLKALALKPEQRYASATALAADLEHWLADEPVRAHAEPWTTKARRWMRRHRTLVTSGVVALLGVVGLLGVSLFFVDQQRRQSNESRQQLAQEKEDTERQRREAVAARDRGSRIIDDMFNDETIDGLKRQKDLTADQKQFLTNMLRYYQEFVREEPQDEQGRARLARAYFRMGSGCSMLGRPEEGVPAFQRALALLEKLAADFPTVPKYRLGLAKTLNHLGILLTDLGQRPAAETAYRRAVELYAKLAADFPTVPEYSKELADSHNNLALLLAGQGQHAAAEAAHRRALAIQDKLVTDYPTVSTYRQDLAISHVNLGRLLAELGQWPAAETAYRRALDLLEKLAADNPTVSAYRRELAGSHVNLGTLLSSRGQHRAAETAYRRAVDLYELLATDFPTVPEYRRGLATSHSNLGALLDDQGKRPAAEASYRRSVDLYEKLAADFPTVPEYRQELAGSHLNLGVLLRSMGQWPAAETAYRRALDLYEKLAADFPIVPQYRRDLAASHLNLGTLLDNQGQRPAAEAAYRQALDILEKLATDFPTVSQYRQDLAGSYVNYGTALRDQGQAEASLAWFAKAIALVEPLVRQEPRLVTERLFLRNAHWGQAEALDRLGRHADALKDWDRALALNAVAAHTFLLRLARARSLARAGQHARAVAEANVLAEAKGVTGKPLYDLACVCALASAAVQDDATLRDQYAARAVALLRQAIAKGYKNIEQLKKDEDLKALRPREDFQKLLQEVEKAKP